MSYLLAWKAAGHEDRAALQQFTCTVPAQPVLGQKRRYHPKRWELEVQSGIRALRPPLAPDQLLLLGEDAEGIAAVCLLADQGDAGVIKIQAIAVASRHRGQGSAQADEALRVALEVAAERGHRSGCRRTIVVGWVDPRNNPSRLMNQRAGFALRRITPAGLEEWVIVLDLEQG
jgi:GNAT superfamily N-acetyltransferase